VTIPAFSDFQYSTLGRTGRRVLRLGFSASYRPGTAAIRHAFDEGVNVFFGYGFDRQLTSGLTPLLRAHREKIILVTGAYNYIFGHSSIRGTCERRLRQFRTDYIDVFMFLGIMKEKQFPARVLEEMCRLREEGKARWLGVSTHDRKLAGRLAESGVLDVLMIRYNAAHRGAETDIFPHLQRHDPGLVSYTATRWTALLRRPRGWPRDEQVPTAGQAYRFALSNPHVDVCLTAPRSAKELQENLAALRQGPLTEPEMSHLRRFGDAVHARQRWFM
jgi:aryl-alcohol dehydrogenase-like predicted oxidoreductase